MLGLGVALADAGGADAGLPEGALVFAKRVASTQMTWRRRQANRERSNVITCRRSQTTCDAVAGVLNVVSGDASAIGEAL